MFVSRISKGATSPLEALRSRIRPAPSSLSSGLLAPSVSARNTPPIPRGRGAFARFSRPCRGRSSDPCFVPATHACTLIGSRLLTKSFRIRTSIKSAHNLFRMNTSKTHDLKSFRMNTSEKTLGVSLLRITLFRSPHQYHSMELTLPLFSYSYALFCTAQNAIFNHFKLFRTLWTKHPGGGTSFHQTLSLSPLGLALDSPNFAFPISIFAPHSAWNKTSPCTSSQVRR